ncbi:MAG: ABC transporter ATP-binding protein/permease [Lachnospiraceae bacterium]|nr:ABC transporter ATP-binding protein/permease [Lachnospiraceae bacterium]
MKRIIHELKPYTLRIIVTLVLAAATVVSTLLIPVYLGEAVDTMVGTGQVDALGLKAVLFKMIMAIIATLLAQLFMNLNNNRIVYGITKKIRQDAFRSMAHMPLSRLDKVTRGDYVSRITADADSFSDGLLLGFTQAFTGVLTIICTIVFMLRIHLGIALLVIALTPLSMALATFIAKRIKRYFTEMAGDRAQMTDYLGESVEGQRLLIQLDHIGRTREEFNVKNEKLCRSSFLATFYSSTVNPSTRFVNSLIYAAVAVAGALLAISGGITVGAVTSFLGYAREYTKPFNEITGVIAEMQNAIVCAGRLFEIIDSEREEDAFDTEKVAPPELSGSIEFRNVSFSYDKDKKLMHDVNLSVAPGERVAIVGPTGAGKTTLINLLMRFYDVDEGAILLDGVDIRELPLAYVRSRYGMVLQETWLKSATIRENMLMADPSAGDEEIVAAAKQSRAHDFIRRLKDRYDTVIGAEGKTLSQGQRQLLCITRLMVSLPPMLILDEATSSIDTRTEQMIQAAFHRMMEGRTTFVVAHRLSTILDADRILYMENGQILEQGSHKELLQKNGRYAKLYYSQYYS